MNLASQRRIFFLLPLVAFAVLVVQAAAELDCDWDHLENVGAACSGPEITCKDWGCDKTTQNHTLCTGAEELDYGSLTDPTYTVMQAAIGQGSVAKTGAAVPSICYVNYSLQGDVFGFCALQ